MKVGDVYKTNNFGSCEVIEYENSRSVVVKFTDTGYIVKTTAGVLVRGQVRDRLAKSVCGVGFIGDVDYKTHVSGKKTKEYTAWKSMIERCYSKVSAKYFPTYSECVVCDDWHNFQSFAKWHSENYPKDGGVYELDKDLSNYGGSGKIYSPELCAFVTRSVNSEESHAKSYKVITPEGVVIDIYNMSKFCRENKLNIGAMCRVGKGLLGFYKGYKAIVDKTGYRKESK